MRLGLLLLLLPCVAACEALLDVPPEKTERFTFDVTNEGWEDVGEMSYVKAVPVAPRSIDNRQVFHVAIGFTGPGQIAEVQRTFTPSRNFAGKHMSALIKINGLNDSLSMHPAQLHLFAKDPQFTPIPGPPLNIDSRGEWFVATFPPNFPSDVFSIGIQISTGTDLANWTTAELYVDTVEIR